MKKIALAVAALLLAGCSQNTTALPNDGAVVDCSSIQSVATSKKAVDLDCLDEGSVIDLSSVKGPVLVNVWGSWCGPCKEEMPVLRAFYEKAKDKVQLIGVDVEEANFDDGRTFVERNVITWPNLYDPDGRSRQYFGMGVPVTWFMAADGSVAHKHVGVIKDLEQILTLTEKYLGVRI